MKPKIELWEEAGFGLLLEYPSGIVYSNQTGGTSCLHPEIEGVFIPLRNDSAENGQLFGPGADLFAYFNGPKHRGAGATRGLDEGDVEFVEQLVQRYNLNGVLAIDRARLRESHEAWIWVVVLREEGMPYDSDVFKGFGPYPRSGVLTWENTD